MQQNRTRLVSMIADHPWGLWWIQGCRLVSIEVRRNLFSWKAGWVYFLAFIPTIIIAIHAVFDRHPPSAIEEDTRVLATIIQLYYIRLAVFFGCLGIFFRLIRGEVIERSLHFYLLSPVRREVLLLAKFVAGSISALLLFLTAIVFDFALLYGAFGGPGWDFILHGAGLGQLGAYLAIAALACLGYGSVFLLLSMMFRNPTPAALLFLGWETINPVLPSLLQKISVASYLRHLMPVAIAPEGLLALLSVETEPTAAWAAIVGLLLLIAAVLFYSCYRMRTLEIRYSTE